MIACSVKFKGHQCFKNDWAGFDCFKPINVIIGKNNAGKSRLLDLIVFLTKAKREAMPWALRCTGVLDQEVLQGPFNPNTSQGLLGGNHWKNHGRHFDGERITWELDGQGNVTDATLDDPQKLRVVLPDHPQIAAIIDARKAGLNLACKNAKLPLAGKRLLRLHAERDIMPEGPNPTLTLNGDGVGAANIVRWHLNSASALLKRDLIKVVLLDALNHVFRKDGQFTAIGIQEYDKAEAGRPQQGSWEIVLTEKSKGQIPLSQSGSGLKTALLVLLNLLVVPKTLGLNGEACVFAFEELENNLHPSLLRRLLRFIEVYVQQEKCMVFLTTHSSVALDVFGPADHAQIIHVSHDGESAKTTTVGAHFDKQSVITELGVKPSDLLQANGVIWVEGPSDRIYLNRWIELASDGKLREGRDYQCAFFGGSLLANEEFVAPDSTTSELANLLRVNPNVIVVCDSDRTAVAGAGAMLKERVARIQNEISRNPFGHIWITAAKEIENYLPRNAIQREFGGAAVEPDQFDHIFPSVGAGEGNSFWERVIGKVSYDKVELASKIAPHMTMADMDGRFDWKQQMAEIVSRINQWND